MDIRGQTHQERQPQQVPGGGDFGQGAPPAPDQGPPNAGPPQTGGPPPNGPPQPGGQPPQGEPPPRQSYMADQALAEPAPPQDAQPSPQQQQMQEARYFEFVRDPATNRITGLKLGGQPPAAQSGFPPLPQPGA